MLTHKQILKEVKDIFGSMDVSVMSEYKANLDGLGIRISYLKDGHLLRATKFISALEELQYKGDPLDVLRYYIKEIYNQFKQELEKIEEPKCLST
jgi:hypothetical protein